METKTCSKCAVEKPLSEFYKRHSYKGDKPERSVQSLCKDCWNERGRLRFHTESKESRDKRNKWSRDYARKLKELVMKAYGGKCACCGESTLEFLNIDHIHNDGADRRRVGEPMGLKLYAHLRRSGFPKDDYQLLCFNCNLAKGLFGQCPHETARQALNTGSDIIDYQI